MLRAGKNFWEGRAQEHMKTLAASNSVPTPSQVHILLWLLSLGPFGLWFAKMAMAHSGYLLPGHWLALHADEVARIQYGRTLGVLEGLS